MNDEVYWSRNRFTRFCEKNDGFIGTQNARRTGPFRRDAGFDGIVVVKGLLYSFGGEMSVGLGDVGIEGGERSQAEVDGLGREILEAEIGDPGSDVGLGDLPGLFLGEI